MKTRWTRLCSLAHVILVALLLAACGDASLIVEDHDGEPDDNVEVNLSLEGIPSGFDQNLIMSDDVFEGRLYGMDEQAVQAFLENPPHRNSRSWLADAQVRGQSMASAIVAAGRAHNVNPLVLLVRIQAEKSLISASSQPSRTHDVDFAFGCGCYDNQPCQEQFRGLDRQLECASQYLRENYERSVRQEGSYFHRGRAKNTLDGARVTPRNHATAAHYNYTPHRAAANLTWQLLKQYAAHASTLDPSLTQDSPWLGDACSTTDQCPSEGSCMDVAAGGMCSMACDGTCPDRPGKATTFCVSLDGGQTGSCVQRAHELNNFCNSLSGTQRLTMQRFVRSSGASVIEREVCAPSLQPNEPSEPSEPSQPNEPVEPGPVNPPDSGDESSDAWIGSVCMQDSGCNFADGNEIGACLPGVGQGICSLACEGYCPDQDGFAPTFCVSLDGGRTGSCVPRAHDLNNHCEGMPEGSLRIELPRHVGNSGVRGTSREVCVPYIAPQG